MADDVTFQATTLATPPDATVVATDEIGGKHYQRVKIGTGADGTFNDATPTDPVPVTLYDSGGSELSVGGGTQYTEDAAAAANPIGNALNLIRDDARGGSLTSADGDNVAARGTDAGELYVKHVDAIPVTDNSGSLTVDNGGTFAVQAAQSGAWNITNISGTVSLPTGASTLAEQQSQTTHLATIAGDTTSIQTAVELIDDTVFAEDTAAQAADKGIAVLAVRRDADTSLVGTDNDYANLQVDANGYLKVEIFDGGGSHTVDNNGTFAVQSTLQTGDNTVGRVKLTDGTDVADVLDLTNSNPLTVAIVDGSGDQITSFGGGTQYTEDAAAAANPVGTALNLVRDDARGGSLTTTDGDNVAARGTNAGELYVKHVDAIPVTDNSGSLTVDNAGTFAVQATVAAGATNIAKAEDVASAGDDVGVPAMAVRKATPANTSGTDGDYEMLQMSAGRLWVDASGVTLTVGSHAVTNAGTFVVQENGAALTALQLIDDTVFAEDTGANAADKGIAILAVRRDADTSLVGTDNDYANLQVDANGYLKVEIFDGGGSHTVDNGGTFAVQESGGALTALQIMDDWDNAASDGASVSGDVAHDTADAGEPVKIGAKATNSLEGKTLVANNDRTDLHAGLDGVLLVRPHTTLNEIISERVSNTDGASTAFSTFGAVANVRNYVTQITVHNAHASTNGYVDIRDGTAGSILWTIPLPANGGATISFDPPLRQPTANTALAYDVSAAITTIYISVNGFQAKEA